MFRKTNGIMFGRTLFEDFVQKDTFQNMINKIFETNSRHLTLKWSGKGVKKKEIQNDRQTLRGF